MFHLDELLKMKPKIMSIQNMNALPDGERIGDSPYVIKHTMHRSSDSFVYLAYHSVTNVHVVVKEFYPLVGFEYQDAVLHLKRNEYGEVVLLNDQIENLRVYQQLKLYYREAASIVGNMSSEKYLLSIIESFECNNTIYVVSEYIPYPTLDILLKEKILLPRQAISLFQSLLVAVESIHKSGYTLKSIKPSNIYITDTHIILGDFNPLKRSYFVSRSSESKTDPYIAPELLSDNIIGETVDVYNVGRILEEMMNHVGYHMMEQNVQRSKGFDPGKIDYILINALKEEAGERIQTIGEIIDLLTHKVVDKTKRVDIAKWFVAAILIIIAVAAVRKSGVLQAIDFDRFDREEEAVVEVVIQSSEFKFITKRSNFDFLGPKMIRWSDAIDDVYEINITGKDQPISVVVAASCIDLNDFGLNPGPYKLSVKNVKQDEILMDFNVVAGKSDYIQAPISQKEHHFYDYESKNVEWSFDYDDMFRVIIYDYQSNELIYDLKTEQNSLDVSVLDLKKGSYLMCVQGYKDDDVSLYKKMDLIIYGDNELKDIVLNVKADDTLKRGDPITWIPQDKGQVNIKFILEKSGDFYEYSVDAIQGFATLSEEMESGYYQVYITHTFESISSKVNEIRILVTD